MLSVCLTKTAGYLFPVVGGLSDRKPCCCELIFNSRQRGGRRLCTLFSILLGMFHLRAASTLLLRANSQLLSAKYGDLYAWLSSGFTYAERRLGTFFLFQVDYISHRKAVSTFLLRDDLQQWSVNYGDSYVGFQTEIVFSVSYDYKHYMS